MGDKPDDLLAKAEALLAHEELINDRQNKSSAFIKLQNTIESVNGDSQLIDLERVVDVLVPEDQASRLVLRLLADAERWRAHEFDLVMHFKGTFSIISSLLWGRESDVRLAALDVLKLCNFAASPHANLFVTLFTHADQLSKSRDMERRTVLINMSITWKSIMEKGSAIFTREVK
jgi:hypothetical protein